MGLFGWHPLDDWSLQIEGPNERKQNVREPTWLVFKMVPSVRVRASSELGIVTHPLHPFVRLALKGPQKADYGHLVSWKRHREAW